MTSNILSFKKINNGKYGEIPDTENESILHLADPMVQSFNFAVSEGLALAVENLQPVELKISEKIMKFELTRAKIQKLPETSGEPAANLYPRRCIESGCTYQGEMTGTVAWTVDGNRRSVDVHFGLIPIMVKSKLCNLYGKTPQQLVKIGEHVNEPGGYFIINGSKKLIRLLTAQRRNYPVALVRETWRQKQKNLTDKGVIIQCVDTDETTGTNILHYLVKGTAKLQFIVQKVPYLVDFAIMLKALKDVNDREINIVLRSLRPNDFFIEKINEMLVNLGNKGLYTSKQCREYIGKAFRNALRNVIPIDCSDEEVCNVLLQQYVFIHLKDFDDKFNLLCLMVCKLYSFVAGESVGESVDVWSMMESQLSGFVYLKYVKDLLTDYLNNVKWATFIKLKGKDLHAELTDNEMRSICRQGKSVTSMIEGFLSTGTVRSKSGIGLMQTTGLSIVMDGLNRMRDMSHLRAIHRGSYFLDMKTVAPRRLTGEAWGFICPVHTPDGAPCGLLNHLTYSCTIPAMPAPKGVSDITNKLTQMGMVPMKVETILSDRSLPNKFPVIIDGRLAGHISKVDAEVIVFKLREMKTETDRSKPQIYKYTEIVLVVKERGQYPGLYLFTTPARFLRPVINIATKSVEFLGTFEQMYLNVAITREGIKEGVHTHVEIDKAQIFSNIGKLVPFSDCNPNPRNMYQCQMGKQTMGTPLHNWQAQSQNKAYRLQYPQVPLVRNSHYDTIDMQDHCMGFNAVLALISYTGYDIEDAMVINKSSMERGFAHGHVYKTEFVDLNKRGGSRIRSETGFLIFKKDNDCQADLSNLDELGLPIPGTKLISGSVYYSTYDKRSRQFSYINFKGAPCVVDKVTINSVGCKSLEPSKASITLREQRYPTIGDKFASRSGQKGIMSRLYPTEDLPFTERGIMPDIIFNPHGIPSRMTAGKLIEVIAGKSAAEFGLSFDSTPFEFDDENPAADYFGKILEKAGFNYYGEDVMYSGKDGRMMEIKIYQGIMYYQRLRHMTEDKYQVRSTGGVDSLTMQPIKGRKRGGAIRFGEMERDALIAHGAAFTLRDRLLDCSDDSTGWVCSKCGGLFSALPIIKNKHAKMKKSWRVPQCALCGQDSDMQEVRMPHAFKYMAAELASLGISINLSISDRM